MMEKFHFVNTVGMRSTIYQYVYPLFGLMTECQYDLCKRDFFMEIVERWLTEQRYLGGDDDEPSMADFMLYSVWTGNNWVWNDATFGEGRLPWRMKDAIPKYEHPEPPG